MTFVITSDEFSCVLVSDVAHPYTHAMLNIVDKTVLFLACIAVFALAPWQGSDIVFVLVALVLSASSEVLPHHGLGIPAGVYFVLACIWPTALPFCALLAYDVARCRPRLFWAMLTVPIAATILLLPTANAALILALMAISVLLSLKTKRTNELEDAARTLRDDMQESRLDMKRKQRQQQENQELALHLATLDERNRIAREIHDNVGHLITRSIMQVEASQVVHEQNPQAKKDFAQVGHTLHTAMDTVRQSVHNLRDDAFDLDTQIRTAAQGYSKLDVSITYSAEHIPIDVAYCFLATVREALSNTTRHSDATRMAIEVAEFPAFYRLRIQDNGTVLPHALNTDRSSDSSSNTKNGMGLTVMRERAQELGGITRFDYENGFRVLMTISKDEKDLH